MPNLLSIPSPTDVPLVGIYYEDAVFTQQAQQLCQKLEQPLLKKPPLLLDNGQFVFVVDALGVSLQATGKKAPGPIRVDFAEGANAHRRQFGGGKGQMIAKAIGVKGAYRPHIVDLTAGLGQDSFVLATLGCEVTLIERSPIVHTLLHDGLQRAALSADADLHNIIERMSLQYLQSGDYLRQQDSLVDVIYFDPMFPERTSKAEVNKSMKAFHALVGSDDDAGEILSLALNKAQYRVVVKRPRKAPAIHQQYPDLALPAPNVVFEGKSTRFDVYTFKKMP